jgi:hypothetical protein
MAENKSQRTSASVAAFLAELGPHRIGGGCLYLSRFAEIDTKVLARLIKRSNKGNRQVTKR